MSTIGANVTSFQKDVLVHSPNSVVIVDTVTPTLFATNSSVPANTLYPSDYAGITQNTG